MLKQILNAVRCDIEVQTLVSYKAAVLQRLAWVVTDRGLAGPEPIIQEIRGARTAVGVLLKSGGMKVLPPSLVASEN